MDYPEHYESDVLSFFDGRPDALALYRVLAAGLARIAPEGRVKVQKSQISFYDGGLFAMASLPKRKGDPGLGVSFRPGRPGAVPPDRRGGGALPRPMDPPRRRHPGGGPRRRAAGLAGGGPGLLPGQGPGQGLTAPPAGHTIRLETKGGNRQ